jgi:hypothetical protein
MTPELRDILENLAAGLFGLDAWVKEPTKYTPPELPLPWRETGHTFAPKDLAVIPFFENLLRASSSDDELGDRWSALSADPLKFSPLADPRAWRRSRGLADAPQFGVVKSSNVWLVNAEGHPVSRATFYTACWPLLKTAVDAKKTHGPVDWEALARELLTNANGQWPSTQQPSSAAFVTQFASDMLYALLGMRTAAPEPWRYAVLIELGEYRRAGNRYTPQDTAAAVTRFEKVLGL